MRKRSVQRQLSGTVTLVLHEALRQVRSKHLIDFAQPHCSARLVDPPCAELDFLLPGHTTGSTLYENTKPGMIDRGTIAKVDAVFVAVAASHRIIVVKRKADPYRF